MVPGSLVNKFLVSGARLTGTSPGVVHVVLLAGMTLVYGLSMGFSHLTDPIGAAIWFGACAAVVLLTWLTKGPLRKDWWRAEPWRA